LPSIYQGLQTPHRPVAKVESEGSGEEILEKIRAKTPSPSWTRTAAEVAGEEGDFRTVTVGGGGVANPAIYVKNSVFSNE